MMLKKRKICIVTSTRADFGLLRPLILSVNNNGNFKLQLAVTGTHLLAEYGNTINEVRKYFDIFDEVKIFGHDKNDIRMMAETMLKFEKYFLAALPDMVFLLGDRFEIFAIAATAYTLRIPIAHIHGGETTAGALDEAYRHCITKMSYLHFCSSDLHRQRIINMGESPERVFNVGAIGLENIISMKLPESKDVLRQLEVACDRPYFLVTYHPTTLSDHTVEEEINELFTFLKANSHITAIFTKANADKGGIRINQMIDDFCLENDNAYSFRSLGIEKYLSLMKNCFAVVGNSSSGLIEAPFFKVPTINIGDRQKDRQTCESVINCEPDSSSIQQALVQIQKNEFCEKLKLMNYPFGDGHVSEKIIETILEFFERSKINLMKEFYDV